MSPQWLSCIVANVGRFWKAVRWSGISLLKHRGTQWSKSMQQKKRYRLSLFHTYYFLFQDLLPTLPTSKSFHCGTLTWLIDRLIVKIMGKWIEHEKYLVAALQAGTVAISQGSALLYMQCLRGVSKWRLSVVSCNKPEVWTLEGTKVICLNYWSSMQAHMELKALQYSSKQGHEIL